MKVFNHILDTINERGAFYFVLIDPDKTNSENLELLIKNCKEAEVDGLLVGGSLLLSSDFNEYLKRVKELSNLPVVIFPGGVDQVSPFADAILFLSIISGRNADNLIGKHVIAAPLIKRIGIEPISTGYMLIESGKTTTAEFMSGSKPIPREKPEIAAAHALAAEYLGMKLVYLEAGSGAEKTVPEEMIYLVSKMTSIPVIVGGGIRDPLTARKKVEAGAKIIVTGNFFNAVENYSLLRDFSDAIHFKSKKSFMV